MAEAQKSMPGATLADVQADTQHFNVLGVYQRQCTTVQAKIVQ